MSDTITVDLDRARELLREVCEANPEKVDFSGCYFEAGENSDHGCLCVVGGVIEKIGKGYDDLGVEAGLAGPIDPNYSLVTALTIDGVELTDEARLFLEAARDLNDRQVAWRLIPEVTEQVMALGFDAEPDEHDDAVFALVQKAKGLS